MLFLFQKVLIYERFWAFLLELLGAWSTCGFVRYFAICWICFCCPTHIAGSTTLHWIIRMITSIWNRSWHHLLARFLVSIHPLNHQSAATFQGTRFPRWPPRFGAHRGPKHQPPGPAGRRSAGAQGGNGHELRKWKRQWHSPVGALGVLESCARSIQSCTIYLHTHIYIYIYIII